MANSEIIGAGQDTARRAPKKNTINYGDSAEVLKLIESKSIDMILTSPPYDDMRLYNGYVFRFETIAIEIYRILKEGSVLVWVVGDQTKDGNESGSSFEQALFFKSIGFKLHDTMIYEKANGAMGSKNHYLQCFEYMFVFTKGKIKTVSLLRDRKNVRSGTESALKHGRKKDGSLPSRKMVTMQEYGRRKNIWKYGVGGGKTGHPAVFPEKLAQDHIISWSKEGDLVLDPFCGSGTTCLMAALNGRNYIGIDTDLDYRVMAEKRIEERIHALRSPAQDIMEICHTAPNSGRDAIPQQVEMGL